MSELTGLLQFHGTNVGGLTPGAMIEPDHPPVYIHGGSYAGYVYSTEGPREAYDSARKAAFTHGGYPHVYQVQPTGELEYDPENDDVEEGDPFRPSAWRSRQPMRVVRELKAKEIRRSPKPKFKHGQGGEPVPINGSPDFPAPVDLSRAAQTGPGRRAMPQSAASRLGSGSSAGRGMGP